MTCDGEPLFCVFLFPSVSLHAVDVESILLFSAVYQEPVFNVNFSAQDSYITYNINLVPKPLYGIDLHLRFLVLCFSTQDLDN